MSAFKLSLLYWLNPNHWVEPGNRSFKNCPGDSSMYASLRSISFDFLGRKLKADMVSISVRSFLRDNLWCPCPVWPGAQKCWLHFANEKIVLLSLSLALLGLNRKGNEISPQHESQGLLVLPQSRCYFCDSCEFQKQEPPGGCVLLPCELCPVTAYSHCCQPKRGQIGQPRGTRHAGTMAWEPEVSLLLC